MSIEVRQTENQDIEKVIDLCKRVYPEAIPWRRDQLESHQRVFPQGQWVAIDTESNRVVGMAASLVLFWDDYEIKASWQDFTDKGMFTNHDPVRGKTLYAAEIMVDPTLQGKGIGKRIYEAREGLARNLGLLRIRAGGRLRGYGTYAPDMEPKDYVQRVIRGELFDPTLTFQLKRGFHVLWVVSGYLRNDPESLGYAAVIEWLNPDRATQEDYQRGDSNFRLPGPWTHPYRLATLS